MSHSGQEHGVGAAAPEALGAVDVPGTTTHIAADAPFLEQFDRVVAERPDALAVVAGRDAITFAQLKSWSLGVAATLRRELGPGDRPVATLLGHTPAAIAAMLGIARTGRPFVNLDPTLPEVRLEHMLGLAGAEAVLVGDAAAELAARLGAAARAIAMVAQAPEDTEPGDRGAPGEPVCLLFTSGSTGRPKGIIWPQATLIKDARVGRDQLRFTPSDRIGLVMPIEFVAGLIVVVWGLTSGATLCMFDPRRHPVTELTAWMARERLTTLHSTPTLLRAVLRAVGPDRRFGDLRLVTTCGEPVTAADVRAVRQQLSDSCEFVNWTGSSEVGVLALHRIRPGDPLGDGPIQAGPPVDGIAVEIQATDDLPPGDSPGGDGSDATGAFGELIVVSEQIALGYCGDGDDLAARFSGDGHTRRYRTGDLATLSPAGELRLHGRRDSALKINGYLVEPSEVEAALLAAAEVADAYVTGDRSGGTPRLVAYVVPAPGHILSVSRLRTNLRQRLPMYMVPPTIVQVPELPRTERGKIDQAALESANAQTLRPESRPPRTELEIYIAQIWRNVLGVRDVGIDDDFFELGGDSLAVEEVLAELQKLGPDLPTATFIGAPTVAGLAAAAEHGAMPRLGGGVVEMRRVEQAPTLFCFAGAGGIALAFERLVRNLDLELEVYGVQMHALEYRGIPDFTVRRAAARFLKTFPALRVRGPLVLVGHSYGGVVAFEVARRLRLAGHDVALLGLIDAYMPDIVPEPAAGRSRGAAARAATGARRVWRALPGDRAVDRLISIPRMLTAGPIRYRGIKHYGGFYNRGLVMQQLYRPTPYPGNTVVYVGEGNATDADRRRWRKVLTGQWTLTAVPGDHHTVLREPYVQSLAEDLREQIRRAGVSGASPASFGHP